MVAEPKAYPIGSLKVHAKANSVATKPHCWDGLHSPGRESGRLLNSVLLQNG
jgi:hypothetical protein